MCIAIAHARMVQYAKHSHCTCQPSGPTPKKKPFYYSVQMCTCTLVHVILVRAYSCTCYLQLCDCILAHHSCNSVRRAVLCDQTIENCQQQEEEETPSHFTSLSCLHNFHHQHKFCKIIGETRPDPTTGFGWDWRDCSWWDTWTILKLTFPHCSPHCSFSLLPYFLICPQCLTLPCLRISIVNWSL